MLIKAEAPRGNTSPDTFDAVKEVSIIGGGPAALIAAVMLSEHHTVHLYEQGRMLGRKFLVAGDGGLNITNNATGEDLYDQYQPQAFMRPMLGSFGPVHLRAWLAALGIPTYVGSSGRVFPVREITPAQVLRVIRDHLVAKGVHLHLLHHFVGFDTAGDPLIEHAGGSMALRSKAVLFALGGASWPRTGSTGTWSAHFDAIGVRTVPFAASNCGVEWDDRPGLVPHAGKPLKNIALSCGGRTVRGEVTITRTGLEGNAIYPLIPQIRQAISSAGVAMLTLDLKPDLTGSQIQSKVMDAAWKERPAALNLDRPSVALLKSFTPLQRYLDGTTWGHDIKHVAIPVKALRPMDEAISTVGGIALDEVDADLSLKKHPRFFVAGEMLDMDAPTGGYLLQAMFSMGVWAARRMALRMVR